MSSIIIDEKLCTKCNICSKVCFMEVIDKASESSFPFIPASKRKYCFKCGHCEAFCAQKALTLDYRVEEKINALPEELVTSQNLSLYLKKRRSIRNYSRKLIDKEILLKVIDAASYAASGGNMQPIKWHVVYDPAEVKYLASLTVDWMRSIQNTPHPLAAYVATIIAKWDSGTDVVCHSAPHLIFAHTPFMEGFYDPTDAIIAMTHIDIAAPSFGLGTCWAGFVKLAVDYYKPMKDALALPEGRKAVCPLMIGYPSYKVVSIPRRNTVEVTWK